MLANIPGVHNFSLKVNPVVEEATESWWAIYLAKLEFLWKAIKSLPDSMATLASVFPLNLDHHGD